MKTGDLFYTNFGRVVHSFWGARATFVMDDFGNSVSIDKDGRAGIGHFIRQGD